MSRGSCWTLAGPSLALSLSHCLLSSTPANKLEWHLHLKLFLKSSFCDDKHLRTRHLCCWHASVMARLNESAPAPMESVEIRTLPQHLNVYSLLSSPRRQQDQN